MDGSSLEAEVERPIIRGDHRRSADADKRLLRPRRPVAHRPPAVKLLDAIKICTRNDNGLTIAGPRHHERERCDYTASGKCGFDMRKTVSGKGSAVLPHEDNICAIAAKLAPQLGLDIDVEIQHGSGDGSGHDHGKQRGGSASATQHGGAHQHSQKHGGMRRLCAARSHLPRGIRNAGAHSSPRKANTGSSPTALWIAAVLPANVTITAIARI